MSWIKAPRDSAGAVHHMRCIFDAEVMAPGQIAVSLSLDASPDGSLPADATLGRMGVVVILVHRQDGIRRVDDGDLPPPRFIDHPIVPRRTADCKGRDVLEERPRKDEVIKVEAVIEGSSPFDERPKREPPSPGVLEGDRFLQIEIPPPSHDQITRKPRRDGSYSREQVGKENDIGVDIAESVVLGDCMGLTKDIIKQRRAKLVASNRRQMPGSRCFGRRRSAFLIAEYQHFAARPERAPACQGISLDHPKMPLKRLGNAKKGQHVDDLEKLLCAVLTVQSCLVLKFLKN
jgi:hypothetical protein